MLLKSTADNRAQRRKEGSNLLRDWADTSFSADELIPFNVPDDMNAIKPEDVLKCSKAFSEEFYAQDLWAIFSSIADTGNPTHVAMHKVWFIYRNPNVNELWASRYPESGTYQASSVCLCFFSPQR